MKKYPFCFLISLIILIACVATPEIMYSSLPNVDYIKTGRKNTEVTVTVKGKILSDTDGSLYAGLYIGEDIFPKIKCGQKIEISGSAFGEKEYKGEVEEIGEVFDNNSAVTCVLGKAKILNKDDKLKVGFNIKARVTVKNIKNAVILPSDCIVQDDKGEFVYKVIGNTVEKKYIKTGEITADGTIIKSGIKENEYIVTNPENLTDKDKKVAVRNV